MPFSIPFASEEEVYDIISSVDTTKGAGYDTIPAKLIQMSAGVITKPITNIINLTNSNWYISRTTENFYSLSSLQKRGSTFQGKL